MTRKGAMMQKFFVVSGYGDFNEFSNCWECELVGTFDNLLAGRKFAEKHYDALIDECLASVNSHWFKSIFVQVLDSSEFTKLGLGLEKNIQIEKGK